MPHGATHTQRDRSEARGRGEAMIRRRPAPRGRAAALLFGGLLGLLTAAPARASAVEVLVGGGREQGPFLSDGEDDITLDQAFLGLEFGGVTSKFSITAPYVRLNRTGLVTFTPEGPAVIGAGGPGRPPWQESDPGAGESGLGDVMVRSQTYVTKSGAGNRPTLTLDVDFKWATADETLGLGTGENDWGGGLDYTQPIGKRLQILGRAFYRFSGSPEGIKLEDRLYLRAGFGVLTAHTAWRFLYETVDPLLKEVPQYDGTGAAIAFVPVEDYKAARGEMVFRNNAGGSVKIWALAGLNDSSPDLGFGMTFASRAL